MSEVLQDPVQCVNNEHYFCKHCIWLHLTRTQTCPVCQDALTPETLRPIARVVANLLQQFQSPKCRYATRGCTSEVKHEALLSHHQECGFAPVQCAHEGCKATVNRQDLDSHQQTCEFRSVTCEECHEAMRQREYGKHGCVLRKELDENKRGLIEMQGVLREIQEDIFRQGDEISQIARDLRQRPVTVHGQQGKNLGEQPSGKTTQPSPTGTQELDQGTGPSPTSDDVETATISSQAPVDRQIFVAGGVKQSYEIFNWSTQEWTLHKDSFFFCHNDAFSFVYDNKIMICGGTDTTRIECLDVANKRSVSTFPAQLPGKECGKGVLCADKILTLGESMSATSLKSPFKTTVLVPYNDRKFFFSYGIARVNENSVVVVGGCRKYPNSFPQPSLYMENVLLYNPTTKVSEKLAPLPFQLSDMAVVVYKDSVITLGGCKQYGALCNDVLMYNVTNQQCSKLPSMLEKR